MSLKIKLLGVRGSLPTPHTKKERRTFAVELLSKYLDSSDKDIDSFIDSLSHPFLYGLGGNTMCALVKTNETTLLIDGGTGIRNYIDDAMSGPLGRGKGELHIFMTHFHWDHIMGLPFFSPIYIPGNKIHFYAVQPELEDVIKQVFRRPYFPVDFKTLRSSIVFHQVEARKPFKIGDLTVTPYMLDHPDACYGPKITDSRGKTYSHAVDHEAIRMTAKELDEDLPFFQGVDLMLFDAQYSVSEAAEKINWGHSSALKGLKLAEREKIKKIVFAHHDPMHTDMMVQETAEESYVQFQNIVGKDKEVDWELAVEGREFIL